MKPQTFPGLSLYKREIAQVKLNERIFSLLQSFPALRGQRKNSCGVKSLQFTCFQLIDIMPQESNLQHGITKKGK